MDWGYFHQPPMIAVFIKIGYALFQHELGVRLMTVLASTAGIPMLFSLTKKKDWRVFVLIFLSLILTHAGVFMAVPDSPLIFFSLVFLVLLRQYLKEDKILTAILLGIVAAALMYSKYHAIVLLGTVLLAVPKLVLRKSFWLTVMVAVLLFIPHVLWQFENDLISFKFHWVVRNKANWSPLLTLNYLTSELILLGPVGLLLFWSSFKAGMKNEFERVLLFVVVGFFGFFFLLSLRGRVEANWTATAFLPLIILGTNAISRNENIQRWFKPVAVFCAVILLVGRIYAASPIAGKGLGLNFPAVGWEEWAQAIKKKADGKPVVFVSSYQLPSQYTFYSGEQGYQFNALNNDGSQFSLWNIDDEIAGLPYVFAIPYGDMAEKEVKVDGFPSIYLWQMDNYQSFRELRFTFEKENIKVLPNEHLTLEGEVRNGTNNPIPLDSLINARKLSLMFYADKKDTVVYNVSCKGCDGVLGPKKSKPVSFTFNAPLQSGKYLIRFGLDINLGLAEQNSDYIPFTVIEK